MSCTFVSSVARGCSWAHPYYAPSLDPATGNRLTLDGSPPREGGGAASRHGLACGQPIVALVAIRSPSCSVERRQRWCTNRDGARRSPSPTAQGPTAAEAGLPSSVIRFRMLQAITASVSCALFAAA